MVGPDGLDHLDADHRVELAGDFAVVLQPHVDELGQAGFSEQVTIELTDYRDVQGEYDAVVSVEMIEAVGMDYWPTYFAALDRLLRPGGRIGLQSITMPHDRMLAARDDYSWIAKYIFPGGLIPSVQAIVENVREHTGLRVVERRSLGPDYARTLARWRSAPPSAAPGSRR